MYKSDIERGIVTCPKIGVSGGNFLLDSGINQDDLRRYLLYWDKLAFAYPNGLGKPNLDALSDMQYLSDNNFISFHDVPVSPTELGLEGVPEPAKPPFQHLISMEKPTEG